MVKITDNGKSDIHDEKGTHKVNILLWKKQQHKNNWAHKKSRSLMQIFILSNTYIYIFQLFYWQNQSSILAGGAA